jgi:hypothetical protein
MMNSIAMSATVKMTVSRLFQSLLVIGLAPSPLRGCLGFP